MRLSTPRIREAGNTTAPKQKDLDELGSGPPLSSKKAVTVSYGIDILYPLGMAN